MKSFSPLVVLSLTLFSSCSRNSSVQAQPEETPGANSNSVAQPSAAERLDQMDTRGPVPLLPMMANHQKQNMREHLVAVQGIVAALATSDFSGIEQAASKIGFSDKMGQMCEHMGAGAMGFSDQALEFHHTADRIVDAAKARDSTRVLVALSATLQTCTSCHAVWKQQVVYAATWQQLTSATTSHVPSAHN